jgi:hypothetical protein
MSDAQNAGFGKFIPGFDFLQTLAKGASDAVPQMPNLTNWIAPTLNVEELDKRISELKTVHFWLEQNAKALGATVQALEVQKMTLATLKGMNFNIGEMANAMKMKAEETLFSGVQSVSEKAASTSKTITEMAAEAEALAQKVSQAAKPEEPAAPVAAPAAAGLVDPMQLWGSLTQQFQTIAASAMKDVGGHAAMDLGKNMVSGFATEAAKVSPTAAPRAAASKSAGKTTAKAPAKTAAKASAKKVAKK